MEPEKSATEVVDQVASFQRMIDEEKTLFIRNATAAVTQDDPALAMFRVLQEHGIVVRDFSFAQDDLRHRGHHAEYRRKWEEAERERAAKDAAADAQAGDDMDDPPVRVAALYDYAGTDLGHLPFNAGDVISISQNFGNGHLLGTLNGRTGLLPESYVRPLGDAPSGST